MPDIWVKTPTGLWPARGDAVDHDLAPCFVRLRDYRALRDRAEKAEAERDAAFAAGQRDMQERAAEACRVTQQERADGGWRSEGMEMSRVLRDAVRALPIKPRP